MSSENEGVVKVAELSGCRQNVGSSDSNQEADFIGDSDEERKRQRSAWTRRSRRWSRTTGKSPLKRIPQADTEGFTSSDGEDLRQIPEQLDSKRAQPVPEPDQPIATEQTRQPYADSLDQLVRESDLTSSLHWTPPVPQPTASPPSHTYHRQSPMSHTSLSPLADAPGKLSPLTLSGDPLFASRTDSPATSLAGEKSGQEHLRLESSSPRAESSGSEKPFGGRCESAEGESAGRRVIGRRLVEAMSIVPEQRPVSRKEAMESMRCYGMLESEESAAFYSDPQDVSRTVEVGPRVLTIENRSVGALKTFRSGLEIMGTEERRKLLLGGKRAERWQLVEDKDASIVPLKRPPSAGAVAQWMDRKNESGERKGEQRRAKVKLMEAVSSGEEGDSGEEMELSVRLECVLGEGGSGRPDVGERCQKRGNLSAEGERKAAEPGLGEGAFSKVEKMKKLFVAEKLEAISEEAESGVPPPESGPKSPVPHQEDKASSENSFQIRGITLDNTFGFSHSVENLRNMRASATNQYMDMLVVELHVQTRKDLCPDPEHDPIRALFYAIAFDSPTRARETGVIVVGDRVLTNDAVSGLCIHHVATEKALIETLSGFVREWDPEILAGYEIEMHSWGYLVHRALVLEMDLPLLLGRVIAEDFPLKNPGELSGERDDLEDVPRSVRHLRISGRIVLDIWRVLRHEVALTSYTFENVMYHLAQERHPLLSYESLSHYWDHPVHPRRHIVLDHYAARVLGVIRILDQLDFVARTSELSRLFGIQFLEVLSRGSQFRVESMMLRLAKPLNYIPASPSVAQRAAMRAPASLPLILEPDSLFYTDPLIVLDFQSLYPSIIIAYNYCFSTCLGRVEKLGGPDPFEFGCTQLQIAPEELKRLENDVSISPAGVVFVKPSVRRGVLPTMLAEILETRLMVKKSMKENAGDKLLQKVLFSRQLGLKLIANVTYGYTAANFSGRMPCIEVGDSVVSKGRETLHRAIQLVRNTKRWGAKVVYGDTDSLFVLTPGRSREEAFKIGREIAEAVTQDNPRPVKLKLEKVYQPSILQTKKRYLGYMYESPEQEKGVFEAKGIETVRRDGCPATGKVLEKALRILFDTRDVSLVRKYVVRQFVKLFDARVNVEDLIFAKEYRGRKGYRTGACVPALHLARQWTQHDKRAEPRVKERVPYVIVCGPPGVPLIRLVRSPKDLLSDPSLRINSTYYITKALIPALQRCFSLLGADVMSWYAAMPRKLHTNYKWTVPEERKRTTISQYFARKQCIVCCQVANGPLCSNCERQPQVAVVCLSEKIRCWERCQEGILQICRSCCGRPTEIECVSLDCPVLFRRNQAARTLEQAPALRQVLARYL